MQSISTAEWKFQFRRAHDIAPKSPLPYSPKEMIEIGKSLSVTNPRQLVNIRWQLRYLLDSIWVYLKFNPDIKGAERIRYLEKEVIAPADKLISAMETFRDEVFSATAVHDEIYNEQLYRGLVAFRHRALKAQRQASENKGNKLKISTDARQLYVRQILRLYLSLVPDHPISRTIIKIDEKRYLETSRFSHFVKCCAEPVFGSGVSMDHYIKLGISEYKKEQAANME